MKRRGKGRWVFLAGLAGVFLFAHPYFAVTRPSGGKVLVAEGWMHHVGLREAAELFQRDAYEHLYVTGTVRPFAYYLKQDEAIEVDFGDAVARLEVALGGLPGVRWHLTSDDDTLLVADVATKSTTHVLELAGRGHRTFRLSVWAATPPSDHAPIGFIGALIADGVPAHLDATRIILRHADGSTEAGQRTHAEEARAELIANGVPDSLLTVIPTLEVGEGGRTASSARSFVAYARTHGIGAFDVATLGVHSRRTWKSYRQANGGRDGVGIIALYDPWCRRWTWWTNYYGVYQMAKEFAALPQTWWNDLR